MSDHITDLPPTKQCCACNRVLPRTPEYFHTDRRNRDGLFARCKDCFRAAQRSRYQGDKREKTLAWQKQYRAENPERRKATQDKYAKKNSERIRRKNQAYANSEQGKATKQVWISRNIEKKREIANRYARRKAAEKAALNPPKKPLTDAERKQKSKAKWHKWNARKLSRPNDFTSEDWKFALDQFNHQCAICGRPTGLLHRIALDHWIPLASKDCPGHIPTNVVPLCHGVGGCNNSKINKDPEEWLIKKFGKRKAKAILARIHEFFSKVRQV
jgi:hypothetical protein